LGWRIDYNMASLSLADRIQEARILPDAVHSDHCPVVLTLN
jgi:exodeoxyribonuclease-3